MSSILTPTGYKSIADCSVGDEVVYFDAVTGAPSVNIIETIQWVDAAEWARWWSVEPSVPAFQFYTINGTWTLNSEQSIWRNGTEVCHAKHLVVGDVIYDDANNDVTITTIEPLLASGWYRFDISGDHSYIVDGVSLHNASRFWVLGTGSWTSSNTVNWFSSSGGGGGSSVPGSADTATFDGASGGGTVTVNFGGTITVQTITLGAFTGTWDNSANNNNITLSANTAFSGTGSGTRTVNLGSATYSISSTSAAGATPWTFGTTTGLTFNAGTSTIDFTGTVAAGTAQTMAGGGLTYSTVKVSGARLNSGLHITGGGTIGTLNYAAAASISLGQAMTITTLTQGAQMTLVVPSGATTTITNAPTITGSFSAPNAIVNSSTITTGSAATISTASGTFSGTYCSLFGITGAGGATFSFSNSEDLGHNSGITITAPSAGTGISRARAFAGFA